MPQAVRHFFRFERRQPPTPNHNTAVKSARNWKTGTCEPSIGTLLQWKKGKQQHVH